MSDIYIWQNGEVPSGTKEELEPSFAGFNPRVVDLGDMVDGDGGVICGATAVYVMLEAMMYDD